MCPQPTPAAPAYVHLVGQLACAVCARPAHQPRRVGRHQTPPQARPITTSARCSLTGRPRHEPRPRCPRSRRPCRIHSPRRPPASPPYRSRCRSGRADGCFCRSRQLGDLTSPLLDDALKEMIRQNRRPDDRCCPAWRGRGCHAQETQCLSRRFHLRRGGCHPRH